LKQETNTKRRRCKTETQKHNSHQPTLAKPWFDRPPLPNRHRLSLLNLIAGILHPRRSVKLLLDAPDAHKARQDVNAARLVVGPAGPAAAKRLLPNHRARALAVDVKVARRVAELVLGQADRGPVRSEHGPCEAVLVGRVDQLAGAREGADRIFAVVVDVDGQDWAWTR
jgi:hypothetical protein